MPRHLTIWELLIGLMLGAIIVAGGVIYGLGRASYGASESHGGNINHETPAYYKCLAANARFGEAALAQCHPDMP